jgi:hypothetical protein
MTMASGDPRDPQYGQPYTGTPVQQAPRSGNQTVLDMTRMTARTVAESANDSHYTADGNLYHE